MGNLKVDRALFGLLVVLLAGRAFAANEGELKLIVVDTQLQQPVAARMHLEDARGKPVIPPKTVAWKDHFIIDREITLKLRPGRYKFTVERGPEYKVRFGDFTIDRNAKDSHTIEMERYVDMKKEGWWSGDLHIHRKPAEIERLMQGEDLHIAPVITWWNNTDLWSGKELPAEPLVKFDENRFYRLLAGEYERAGGALLFFNLDRPLPIKAEPEGADDATKKKSKPVSETLREHPSGAVFLQMARENFQAHVDIEKPFWWDMPMWIATDRIDSIGLANNHLWRDGGLFNEAWGKPRDKVFYPDPQGNGRWSQDIYYELLNCGLRIPPSAGSASGVLNNPVGYNRVYVHCDGELSWEKWWEGLRAGRVVVTNGPLLRPRVNGELPGHVFSAASGERVELHVTLNVAMREKVDYLEVVKDGKVVHEVRLADYAANQGKLPPVVFDRSGWLLVRAVTNNDKTYRYGSTGPYYVEIGQQRRVSKKSSQFFLDWVRERMTRIKVDEAAKQDEVMKYHRAAEKFWQDFVERANAE